MYTYGGRPYENIAARDLVDALENVERLAQPEICTIDVYMILIKCMYYDWVVYLSWEYVSAFWLYVQFHVLYYSMPA